MSLEETRAPPDPKDRDDAPSCSSTGPHSVGAPGSENGNHHHYTGSAHNNTAGEHNSGPPAKDRHHNMTMYAPKFADPLKSVADKAELPPARPGKDYVDGKPKEGARKATVANGTPPSFAKQPSDSKSRQMNNGEKGGNEAASAAVSSTVSNGKSSKNGKTSMPPPQSRPKPSSKTKSQKAASSPQPPAKSSSSTPTKSPRPPAPPSSQANYQKPKYAVPSSGTATQNNSYGHSVQYNVPSNFVTQKVYVPSSSSANPMYAMPQRGPQNIRSQGPTSGNPQVIIQTARNDQNAYQPPSSTPSAQPHFIITQQQEQYGHRQGPPPGQRPYVPPGAGPTSSVSTQQQQHQQQVVIQFHQAPSSSAAEAANMAGQRLFISQHPQQLMEKRYVANYPPPGTSAQAHCSQPGVSQQQPTADFLDRQPSSSAQAPPPPGSRVHAKPGAQPKLHGQVKTEEVFVDSSVHPDPLHIPDSFHTILDQIHASGEAPRDLYKKLKRHFKFLVYEELRSSQRRLLKLSRDKNFLLDRLLAHEPLESDEAAAPAPADESDADSDVTVDLKPKPKKKKVSKKRPAPSGGNGGGPPAKKSAKDEDLSDDGDSKQGVKTSQTSASNASPCKTDFSALKDDKLGEESPQPSGASTPATLTPVKRPSAPAAAARPAEDSQP